MYITQQDEKENGHKSPPLSLSSSILCCTIYLYRSLYLCLSVFIYL